MVNEEIGVTVHIFILCACAAFGTYRSRIFQEAFAELFILPTETMLTTTHAFGSPFIVEHYTTTLDYGQ